MRAKAPMPRQFTVHDEASPPPAGYRETAPRARFTIVCRWRTQQRFQRALVVIALDGLLILACASAARQHHVATFLILGLLLWLVTYVGLAQLLNRTFIVADGEMLRVKTRPLLRRGECEVALDELEQIYCETHATRGEDYTTFTYDVIAVLKDGKKLPLVERLREEDHARFLEQALAARLGLDASPGR